MFPRLVRQALFAALCVPALAAQVALADLPELARARANRLRPAQEEALKPFWADLALDYAKNQKFLDERIAKVAAIGDSAVPLLLEKLTPLSDSDTERQLAANCRRVLERLDPASFLDALVELARSGNETARTEAIGLLGKSGAPRASSALANLLQGADKRQERQILTALAALHDPSAQAAIAPYLQASDRQLRSAALEYFVAAAPSAALPAALRALAQEGERSLLPLYVDYFARTARGDGAVATALLQLLDRDRMDFRDLAALLRALATIAPKGHEPTEKRLMEWIETGDTGALALECAKTLRALGDKGGMKKVLANLNEQLKRPSRRQEPQLYEDRANLHCANEDWKDAIEDFEKVMDLSNSTLLQRRIRSCLLRCEAERSRWDRMLKHMKDGALSLEEIQALAEAHEAVREGLQKPSVRSYLQGLQKEAGR